ncbi:MAG: hypothetical protein ABI892_10635, partial [Flavobacterium sp.]
RMTMIVKIKLLNLQNLREINEIPYQKICFYPRNQDDNNYFLLFAMCFILSEKTFLPITKSYVSMCLKLYVWW